MHSGAHKPAQGARLLTSGCQLHRSTLLTFTSRIHFYPNFYNDTGQNTRQCYSTLTESSAWFEMSDLEPFPNCTAQFPATPSSSNSRRRLLSPVSHYRELFASGRKRRKLSNGCSTLAPQHSVQPSFIESAQMPRATNESQPPYRADAATYTYKFAQDFAMSEDIIESDATDDCSDYEPLEPGGNAKPCPSAKQQALRTAKRQLGALEGDGPPQQETQDSKSNPENEKMELLRQKINHIHDSPLSAPTSDSSEGILSTSDGDSKVTLETTPPHLESEDKSAKTEFIIEELIRGRQPSLQLGNTPTCIRRDERGSSPTVLHYEQSFEEPNLKYIRQTTLETITTIISSQKSESPQSVIEEVLAESRQTSAPEPSTSHESALSIIEKDCDSLSGRTEEVDDIIPEYKISNALLAMHNFMSKTFWADDHQWLAAMALPVSRSQPGTPYSDKVIKTAKKLIETIDSIKAKEGNSKQARFAVVMNHRISSLIERIHEACSTMCHLLIGKQSQDSHQRPHVPQETVYRMRKYVIPRLVVVLSKAFTLLCNPTAEMRFLVIIITEQICLDTEQILKIIELGTKTNENGLVAEVEEFAQCLVVVREWASVERDTRRALRSIAL